MAACRVCLKRMVLVLAMLAANAAAGFDTRWHRDCTGAVADSLSAQPHAARLLLVGTFGPDFLFSLDVIAAEVARWRQAHGLLVVPGLNGLLAANPADDPELAAAARASLFLHFDDLQDGLIDNQAFALLLDRLYANTRSAVADYGSDPHLDEDSRRCLVLMTVGSSLHALQDFYCHTNWIHLDFAGLGVVETPASPPPTWFTFLEFLRQHNLDDLNAVGVRIQSGCFTADPNYAGRSTDGLPKTHRVFAHDNSYLRSDGVSQARFHRAGPVDGEVDPVGHMSVAAGVASRGSLEWVRRLLADGQAGRLLAAALAWRQPALVLDPAAAAAEACDRVSALCRHFDGDLLPPESAAEVDHLLSFDPIQLIPQALRARACLPDPTAGYWRLYVKHRVLNRLAAGLGDPATGRYCLVLAPPTQAAATALGGSSRRP